jgi:muconolactone D-isomerase
VSCEVACKEWNHVPGAERDEAQRLQRTGEWLHLWRVVGRYVSVLDVDGHARLHEILSDLPLARYLDIRFIPLTIHPSAISPGR